MAVHLDPPSAAVMIDVLHALMTAAMAAAHPARLEQAQGVSLQGEGERQERSFKSLAAAGPPVAGQARPSSSSRNAATSPGCYRLVEKGLPDAAREQEGHGACVHLLVVEHMVDQRLAIRLRQQPIAATPSGRPDLLEMRRHALAHSGRGLAPRRIAEGASAMPAPTARRAAAGRKTGFGLERMR